MTGIVMLVNEFPPLMTGGAERQAERLAVHLAQKGWPVWVITKRLEGLPPVEEYNGLQIIRPMTFGPGKLKSITYIFGTMAALWKLRRKFDILHAHLAFGPAFAGLLAARLLGKKIVIKLGNSGSFGDIQVSQRTRRGRLRLYLLKKWVNAVIALDELIDSELRMIGVDASAIHYIPNGINVKDFSRLEGSKKLKQELGLEDKIVMIFVGRFSRQKSIPTLLEIMAATRFDHPELHLLLVGDGPDLDDLKKKVLVMEVDSSVTFAGNQPEVRKYLNLADMFLLPSLSEGISNALLEAMSAGLACVVSEVGANPEILDRGRCGVLLPPDQVEEWIRTVTALAGDFPKRQALGLAARERVVSVYDFDVVGAAYENLYRDLMASG